MVGRSGQLANQIYHVLDEWTWAKHVTLGVDPNTLKNHPTTQTSILAYCEAVKAVPGAKAAGGKSNAAIFEPQVFVGARTQLIEVLAALTHNVETRQASSS